MGAIFSSLGYFMEEPELNNEEFVQAAPSVDELDALFYNLPGDYASHVVQHSTEEVFEEVRREPFGSNTGEGLSHNTRIPTEIERLLETPSDPITAVAPHQPTNAFRISRATNRTNQYATLKEIEFLDPLPPLPLAVKMRLDPDGDFNHVYVMPNNMVDHKRPYPNRNVISPCWARVYESVATIVNTSVRDNVEAEKLKRTLTCCWIPNFDLWARPASDFEAWPSECPLYRLPDGGSSFFQFLRERDTGVRCFAKCSCAVLQGEELRNQDLQYGRTFALVTDGQEEIREVLALRFYGAAGVLVPWAWVAKIQTNLLNDLADLNQSAPHIISVFIGDFTCFGEDFIDAYVAAAHRKPMDRYKVHLTSVRSLELTGFGSLLAAACLLADEDCIGASGKNAGYVIRDGRAQTTIIDGGAAFTARPGNNKVFASSRDIKIAIHSNGAVKSISFSQLNHKDKQEFLEIMCRFVSTPREVYEMLFCTFEYSTVSEICALRASYAKDLYQSFYDTAMRIALLFYEECFSFAEETKNVVATAALQSEDALGLLPRSVSDMVHKILNVSLSDISDDVAQVSIQEMLTGGYHALYLPGLWYRTPVLMYEDPGLKALLRNPTEDLHCDERVALLIKRRIKRSAQIVHACTSPFVARIYGYMGSLESPLSPCVTVFESLVPLHMSTPGDATLCCADIVKAFYFIHQQGVMHFDVKPANIFRGNEGYKLAGFDFAAHVGELSTATFNHVRGSRLYMAPEVARAAPLTEELWCRGDYFALGVTYLELVVGEMPNPSAAIIDGRMVAEVIRRTGHLHMVKSSVARQFMERLLADDGHTRPEWRECNDFFSRKVYMESIQSS